ALLRAPAFSAIGGPRSRSGILLPVETPRQSPLVPGFQAQSDDCEQNGEVAGNFRAAFSARTTPQSTLRLLGLRGVGPRSLWARTPPLPPRAGWCRGTADGSPSRAACGDR